MRNREETTAIQAAKYRSNREVSEYINNKGERFVFDKGELIQYTDTRVIEHESDRLVDLSTHPYIP